MWHSWVEFGFSPSNQKIGHVSTEIIYPDDMKGKLISSRSPLKESFGNDLTTSPSPSSPVTSCPSLKATMGIKEETLKTLQLLMDEYYEKQQKREKRTKQRESSVEQLMYAYARETRQVPTTEIIDSVATIVKYE